MEYPNYYGILPAAVRYAKIPDRAKILFSEITALANKDGYCYASNGYFAGLYDCTPQAISKMIKALEAANFVQLRYVTIESINGNVFISERRIYPVAMVAPINQELRGYQPQVEGGINQELRGYQPQVEDNNTRINNTSKNKSAANKLSASKAASTDNFCTIFDSFLESQQIDKLTWTPKEAKQAYELSKLISKRLVQKSLTAAPSNVREAFTEFLTAAWDTNDKFLRDGFTPSLLVSQFNRIIMRCQQAHKTQTNGKQIISSEDFNAVVARINAGL